MGIAERFKNNVSEKDLFKKDIENKLNENNIKFMSKPVEIVPETVEDCPEKSNNILGIVKSELLKKITNTPYWNEFSNSRKEKMITAYFDSRLKNQHQNYANSDIKEILINTTK